MHPKVYRIVEYWRSLAKAVDRLPSKSRFDPIHVPELLQDIYLLQVVYPGPRFLFKVVGESVIAAGAPGRRGKYVDEITLTGAKPTLNDALLDLVASGQPVYYKGPPTLKHEKWVAELEGVMLPMAEDGLDIDHILCLTVYHRKAMR